MGNVLRALGRDLMRLLKTPAALAVVLALVVLPSGYSWYNIVAFWDPYGNTGNLRVCVVNEDAGAQSAELGELRVGDEIVAQLRENHDLAWAFTDRETALDGLASGESYAAFIIPEDFSADLLTLTTGDFQQPSLEYYVNEKAGPVSPKITDTGATTLDETINAAFVSTVSDAAVKAVGAAAGDAERAFERAQSEAVGKVEAASRALATTRDKLAEAVAATERADAAVASARGTLRSAAAGVDDAAALLRDVSADALAAQRALSAFSATAAPLASEAIGGLADVSARASVDATAATSSAAAVQTSVETALSRGQAALDESVELADGLRVAAALLPEGDTARAEIEAAVERLDAQNAEAQQRIDGLSALNGRAAGATVAVGDAAAALGSSIQSATDEANGFSARFFGTSLPAAYESLAEISVASATLADAVADQKTLIEEATLLADELSLTLEAARTAASGVDGLIANVEADLAGVRDDVLALSGSTALTALVDETDGLDADAIAAFIGAPTAVETEQLYPLNAYGSAMAPLFMSLTFWIGAFMLVVIMRQEVDGEGVPGLTQAQRYLARFALFGLVALLQAIVCCIGVLAIGVEAASVPALFAASAAASLAYLSIIFALSATLQHIGKGLCIVLVFAQIPGATGLYPVELTSPFFQAVYPLLPFTYGIDALREAICGFYGLQFAGDLAALGVFFALALAFGLIVGPLLGNVNAMVADQVRASGVYNGERAVTPARPYRITQIVRALAEKDAYRAGLIRRRDRFERRYPKLMRGAIIAGVVVPVGLGVVFALTPTEKVVLLTAWLAWTVAIFVFIIVVESLRASIERQLGLEGLSNERLIALCTPGEGCEQGGARRPAEGAHDEESAAEDPASETADAKPSAVSSKGGDLDA